MNAPQSNPTHPSEWRDHLVLTLFGFVLLAILISLMLPLQYPFANDTAGYIQEAQHFLQGDGLLRGTRWYDTSKEFAPFPLFPPGYAIEIAGFSKLGLSLPHAALAIAWLSWLLLLPAVAFAVRPLVGRWPSIAIGVLVVSSPGFVKYGYLALSDTGMTLFSVLSLGILLRQDCSKRTSWRAIMLSGLLAGCAYALRNAAAVLPLTVIAFLGVSLLTRQLSLRASFTSGLLWGAGFAALALPLFYYNLQTFGSIQPYFSAHGATEFGVLKAFRISLWSTLFDISAWRFVANMAWSLMAMMLLLLPVGLFLLGVGWQRWRQSARTFRPALLLLLLYMSIGFAMIVWGRSRFDWIEVTLIRQLMPYSWAILAAVVWALQPLADKPDHKAHTLTGLLLVAGLLLMAGRLNIIWSDLQREAAIQATVKANGYASAASLFPGVVLTNRIKQNTSQDHDLIDLLRTLPDNAHIVSNHGPMLSLETGRHIRSFDPTPKNLAALVSLRPELTDRALILVMIPSNEILRSTLGDTWQDETLRQVGDRYQILLQTPTALVVSLQ